MSRRSLVITTISIVVVFSVGLSLFLMFSSDLGDGLERTMEEGGAEEGEPVYSAPLDYGDGYSIAFVMGIIGAIASLAMVGGIGLALRKKDGR